MILFLLKYKAKAKAYSAKKTYLPTYLGTLPTYLIWLVPEDHTH